MKLTSFALLLSLVLHICVIVIFCTWMAEKPTPKTEQISLHMSTLTLQSVEQSTLPSVATEPLKQEPAVPHEGKPKPQKIPSKTRDITAVQAPTSQPSLATIKNDLSESNTSLVSNDAPSLQPHTTITALEPMPPKPTYLELHGTAIKQAIEKEKAYPELARKRLITGIVEMSFTLTPHGDIEEIKASSNSKILSASAVATVHKAKIRFPLPLENVTIKIPIAYVLK